MFDDYAKWVRQTCACKSCALLDAPKSVNCLVNKNINPNFTSMPQAGYIGLDYQSSFRRVLVLGKNPAGGPEGDFKNDAKHYPRLLRIFDAASLKEESYSLQNLYNDWPPLRDLRLGDRLNLKPSEIAYSNQILCRSDNHKDNINRGLIGENKWKDIRPIYLSCFRNRLVELIRILEPLHIIALGKKKTNSWPNLLERLIATELPHLKICVWPVVFPRHFN